MNYILFDGPSRANLLPFTFTRPVADIRIGILTIREKWEGILQATTTTQTEDYLASKWPISLKEENIFINASILPSQELKKAIEGLNFNERLQKNEHTIAYKFKGDKIENIDIASFKQIEYTEEILQIQHTWDIYQKNGQAIAADFKMLTEGRKSQPISNSNFVKNESEIFIEEGAQVENCSLNAASGPIYIGKSATVMEGSLIRGPFALCDNATVKLGAKIYGPTTVGPNCKVGGEVNNSVLFENSNKGHDGFLGNSVLGEWCNIGADSNNSNLKNNYAAVRLWNYSSENFAKTGLQFCGLMMGDHSKCGINTMFNTGTVIGVSANIFGSGFPRNFVPSFSWGGSAGVTTYKLDKVFEVAEIVMYRKNIEFSQEDKAILEHVFEFTKKYRRG